MHTQLYIQYGWKFILVDWQFDSNLPINFNLPIFHLAKNFTVKCHYYCKIIAFTCTRPAARCASLNIGLEFTIDS